MDIVLVQWFRVKANIEAGMNNNPPSVVRSLMKPPEKNHQYCRDDYVCHNR